MLRELRFKCFSFRRYPSLVRQGNHQTRSSSQVLIRRTTKSGPGLKNGGPIATRRTYSMCWPLFKLRLYLPIKEPLLVLAHTTSASQALLSMTLGWASTSKWGPKMNGHGHRMDGDETSSQVSAAKMMSTALRQAIFNLSHPIVRRLTYAACPRQALPQFCYKRHHRNRIIIYLHRAPKTHEQFVAD